MLKIVRKIQKFGENLNKSLKNYILLVLPFEEINIKPKLSSPPVSESRGGYRERHKWTDRRTKDVETQVHWA